MRKETILIGALLLMTIMGLTIACETPEPPVTPTPNCTPANTTVVVDNSNNNTNDIDTINTNNNTNTNNNANDQNQTQNQGQDQNQNQNTTVILDNQNNNQNNQSNNLDVIFQPVINVLNYFNITNTANPVFTNNPVITLQSSNGQLIDVALDQETVQYGYNEQGQSQLMISKNVAFPAVLCKGTITPYGTVLGVQEHNATAVPMQSTGLPIGAILVGASGLGLVVVGFAKAGLWAKFGW